MEMVGGEGRKARQKQRSPPGREAAHAWRRIRRCPNQRRELVEGSRHGEEMLLLPLGTNQANSARSSSPSIAVMRHVKKVPPPPCKGLPSVTFSHKWRGRKESLQEG